jgi:ferredoxin
MTHTIAFLPHQKKITVADGENLIRAAMEAGVHINASCGGGGVCGKCRVIIESGEVAGGISEQLSVCTTETKATAWPACSTVTGLI